MWNKGFKFCGCFVNLKMFVNFFVVGLIFSSGYRLKYLIKIIVES